MHLRLETRARARDLGPSSVQGFLVLINIFHPRPSRLLTSPFTHKTVQSGRLGRLFYSIVWYSVPRDIFTRALLLSVVRRKRKRAPSSVIRDSVKVLYSSFVIFFGDEPPRERGFCSCESESKESLLNSSLQQQRASTRAGKNH